MNETTNEESSRRDFFRKGLSVAGAAALWSVGGNATVYAATFTADELIYMSAEELIPLFKTAKLSPVDLLKAQISRYEAVGKLTNSVTYTHFDTAMEQAKESERRYANGTARALEGITVAVKDEHHDKGWIITQGSNLFKDDRMDHADPIVTKLKEAGAVLHLQTTVPEFYLNGVTWTKLWGVSRCPWNLKYAVGGSSGGSGGSLAAGFCTLATGSDMGGSVRLPCAYNGLYGFKPPFGRIVTPIPLSYYSGTGPMARTFHDMALLHNVMTGQTPHGPATLPKLDMPLTYPGIKGMKIAYSAGLSLAPLDSDTKKGMTAAIEDLRSLGAEVVEIDLDPGFTGGEIMEIFSKGVLGTALGGVFASYIDRTDEMTDYAAYFVKKAAKGEYGAVEIAEYEAHIKDFYVRVSDAVFENGYDALIMPTLATPHVPADYDPTKGGLVVEGQKMDKQFILALTIPWNFLNWCPVVNVPTRLSSQGMPMGMQIVGKPYDDLKVFQIASAYESVAPKLFRGKQKPDFRKK